MTFILLHFSSYYQWSFNLLHFSSYYLTSPWKMGNWRQNLYTYTPLASCIHPSLHTLILVHTLIQHIRLSAWIHWLQQVSTGICLSCPQSSWGIHDLTLAQILVWTPGEKGREGVNLTCGLWQGHRLKRHPQASNGSKTGSMCDMGPSCFNRTRSGDEMNSFGTVNLFWNAALAC